MANMQAHTITNYNIENLIDEQVEELTAITEVLDQRDVEGKPLGSGWKRVCQVTN